MSEKLILCEYMAFEAPPKELIEEAIKGGKSVLVNNVLLQQHGIENGNKRIYPESVLKREDAKYQKMIDESRALGELDHPDSAVVNLSNVSHRVVKTWWEGAKLFGNLEVLHKFNDKGQKLLGLLQHGVKLGISSRGVGTVKQPDGKNESSVVQDDFELIAFDVVSTPSVPGAFLHIEHKRFTAAERSEKNLRLKQAIHRMLGDDYHCK